MNLTDLRGELTTHADDLGPAPDLRTGVAHRIRTIRRRRAVTAGSVATLAVIAFAVGVATSLAQPARVTAAGSPSASAAPMIGADGMPFRTVPDAPGDIVKNGLRLRARVADDTLAAGFIGDRGQGQFSLVWEPTTTHVSFGAECYLPGLSDAEAARYLVSVGLEGTKAFFGNQCTGRPPVERDLPPGGAIPGEPGQGWTELTVGQATRVRVQLLDAKTSKPASVDGAQLTGAVYELGPLTEVRDGAQHVVGVVPDAREHAGHTCRLLGLTAGPVSDLARRKVQVEAPPSGPYLVTYGTVGTGDGPTTPAFYTLGGVTGEATQVQEGGSETLPQPEGRGQELSVRLADGSPDTAGTAYIATYALKN